MPHFAPTMLRTIRRSSVLSLVSVLFVSTSLSQAGSSAKEDNLYSMALFVSIAEMEKSWGSIDDSDGGRIRTDYRHVVVESDSETAHTLPSEVGDYHVEYLDNESMIARYKMNRKEFSVLTIHPAVARAPIEDPSLSFMV